MSKQATVVSGVALTYVEQQISRVTLAQSTLEASAADYVDVAKWMGEGMRDPFGLVSDARQAWREFRETFGETGTPVLLTDPKSQPKLGKSDVPSFGLMLSPATRVNDLTTVNGETFARVYRAVNTCPMASLGCRAACLNTSGKGRMPVNQKRRAIRTAFLIVNPWAFLILLVAEIHHAARRHGVVRVRLNVVSDIRWELCARPLFAAFPHVRFYDYTAWSVARRDDADLPANYSLTRSAKETHTVEDIRAMVDAGANVAVPFAVTRGHDLPTVWHGMRVIDGDASDDRTLDPRGVIVGLRAKGDGIGDTSGFVRDPYPGECQACGADDGEPCDPFCIGAAMMADLIGA